MRPRAPGADGGGLAARRAGPFGGELRDAPEPRAARDGAPRAGGAGDQPPFLGVAEKAFEGKRTEEKMQEVRSFSL